MGKSIEPPGDALTFSTVEASCYNRQVEIYDADCNRIEFTSYHLLYRLAKVMFHVWIAQSLWNIRRGQACRAITGQMTVYPSIFWRYRYNITNTDEEISHGHTALSPLQKVGVSFSPKRSELFFFERIEYLRHIIWLGKLELPDHSTNTFGDLKPLCNLIKFKSLVSSCNVNRQSVPNSSRIVAPFSKKLKSVNRGC